MGDRLGFGNTAEATWEQLLGRLNKKGPLVCLGTILGKWGLEHIFFNTFEGGPVGDRRLAHLARPPLGNSGALCRRLFIIFTPSFILHNK